MNDPNTPWWVLPGLAVVAMTIFGGGLAASAFMADGTLRTAMFTGALTLATGAMQYFFGSSAGSQRKDDTIAASSAKKDETIAASATALATSVPGNGHPPATP